MIDDERLDPELARLWRRSSWRALDLGDRLDELAADGHSLAAMIVGDPGAASYLRPVERGWAAGLGSAGALVVEQPDRESTRLVVTTADPDGGVIARAEVDGTTTAQLAVLLALVEHLDPVG